MAEVLARTGCSFESFTNEKLIKLTDKDQICKTSFKMAAVLALTECSFQSVTNNEKSIKLSDCRKCADLEKQLHQVLNKLSSAQLIIDLFNKEYKPGSMDMMIFQQVNDLEECDKWK